MKIKHLIASLFLVLASTAFSQDFDLDWSKKSEYSNKKDGYVSEFLGSNDFGIYVLNEGKALRKSKNLKRALFVYDKSSFKQLGKVELSGYKSDKARASAIAGLSFIKAIISQDKVYVLWKKVEDKTDAVFVETFDNKLKRTFKLKKMYSITKATLGKGAQTNIVVLDCKEQNNLLLVGAEYAAGKGEEVTFDYVLLDNSLAEIAKNKIQLPVVLTTNRYLNLSSDYEFNKDGNLYITSYVSVPRESIKKKDTQADSYTILSVIDMSDQEMSSFTLKSEGKNIFNIGLETKNGQTKIYGFFNDLEKDKTGRRTSGIFSTSFDDKTKSVKEMNFQYFSKSVLDELFGKNSADRAKSKAILKKKRENIDEANENTLDGRYVFEYSNTTENGDILLFASLLYNYTVTVCTSGSNGQQNCRQEPRCDRRNLAVFRLGDEGEIVWAKNVDRNITYGRFDVRDVRVAKSGDKYYAIYGGASVEGEFDGLSKRERKRLQSQSTSFVYSVFDEDGSDPVTERFTIQKKSETGELEKKYVNPLGITVVDDKFFISSSTPKLKILPLIGVCATSIVCFPVGVYLFFFKPEVITRTSGYIGVMEPIK